MVEGKGSCGYTLPRRGGRAVECGGLENRYVGNPGVGGSNPPLSAFQLAALSASQHAQASPSLVSKAPASPGAFSAFQLSPAQALAEMLTSEARKG